MFCGSKAYDAAWIATIQFIGALVGALVYGHLGDYFGRKPVSFVGISIGIIFGVASGRSFLCKRDAERLYANSSLFHISV